MHTSDSTILGHAQWWFVAFGLSLIALVNQDQAELSCICWGDCNLTASCLHSKRLLQMIDLATVYLSNAQGHLAFEMHTAALVQRVQAASCCLAVIATSFLHTPRCRSWTKFAAGQHLQVLSDMQHTVCHLMSHRVWSGTSTINDPLHEYTY